MDVIECQVKLWQGVEAQNIFSFFDDYEINLCKIW